MEKTQEVKMDFGTLSWSASAIEKVHNCEDCPIRKLGMEKPHSFFAKMHAWHSKWWPGWKARQAKQCAYRAAAKIQA